MRNFRLITGNEPLTEAKRNVHAERLLKEIADNKNPTDRDQWVYAYHWACLGYPASARTHLLRIELKYFYGDMFKDLYRSLLAELILRTNAGTTPELVHEYEFFIVVKRGLKVFAELELPALTRQALDELTDEFETYSRF